MRELSFRWRNIRSVVDELGLMTTTTKIRVRSCDRQPVDLNFLVCSLVARRCDRRSLDLVIVELSRSIVISFGPPSMSRRGVVHTWYVSVQTELSKSGSGRTYSRLSRSFPLESDAKKYAAMVIREGRAVTAGTINPKSPKVVIPSSGIRRWIEDR